jgi:hypothetical protein
MDGALVGAGLLWPRLTNDKTAIPFWSLHRTVSDFQDGKQKFFVFKNELTGPRTGFSQIHLCETGTRARTIFSLFLTKQNPMGLHRSIAKMVWETKDEILTSGNGSCVAIFWSEVLGLIFGMSDLKLEPETEVKSQEK